MKVQMKFMRLLTFGTVMLMANGAGAQNSVKSVFAVMGQVPFRT